MQTMTVERNNVAVRKSQMMTLEKTPLIAGNYP